ncbi:hypothetical protein MAR_008355 [Mya arenaria]|uniref:Uncharacterized protein n=1 Tax=Mya arenaria TaxID=6604 RepID=A0ABY7DYW5_MYAAR|nr:hypothetical protein MAR_008355 [Mya arenaria]
MKSSGIKGEKVRKRLSFSNVAPLENRKRTVSPNSLKGKTTVAFSRVRDSTKCEEAKVQSQIFTDYLANLHQKYVAEHPDNKMSISIFKGTID